MVAEDFRRCKGESEWSGVSNIVVVEGFRRAVFGNTVDSGGLGDVDDFRRKLFVGDIGLSIWFG